MRKIYLIALSLLAALPIAAQRVGNGQPARSAATESLARFAPQRQAFAQAKEQTEVIVDEDFSGLTAGSEDQPDSESLLRQDGYVKDSTLFKPYDKSCTQTWGGHSLYAAGGAIAVVNGGWLSTPTGDYSGHLRATFRARLIKGQDVSDASIDIVLLRRSKYIDFKRVPVKLTDQWQTFTFEADNGWWYDTMIQLYTDGSFSYLVDDFHIEHVRTSIEPPAVAEAYDLKPDGFTAAWTPTADASEYLLSVYSKTPDPALEKGNETFEQLNAPDGRTLAPDNPGLSAGWEVHASEAGSQQIYTDEGYHSANGTKALCLANDGDYLLTPKCDVGLTACSFWARVDDRQQEGTADGRLLISALTEDGWFEWASVKLQDARKNPGGVNDLTPGLSLFYKVFQVKFTLQKAAGDRCQVAIDDVSYTAPGASQLHYALHDHVVSGNETDHYVVTGLDPDADYSYTVKARNDSFTSAESREMEVFDVHTPVAQPATEVGDDGYTAHWTCGKKADYFRLDQKLLLHVDKDTPDYPILTEDFSKVVSDYDETFPEEVELTTVYQPIDQYTHVGGWQASSYSIANGMLGGIDKRDNYLAGCIVTPTIDLSHNGGQCQVYVRAYGYGGDFLVIRGTNPASYAGVYFGEEGGFVEQTVTIPLCTSRERLYIYSNNYYPFLLDSIRVSQDLKAGDEVTLINKSVAVDSREARSVAVEGVEWPADASLNYSVTAFRNRHGDAKDIWASAASNLITVKDAPTGIGTARNATAGSQLAVVSGGLSLTCAQPADLEAYTTAGVLVTSRRCNAGTTFVPLSRGTYVVRFAGRGATVSIR